MKNFKIGLEFLGEGRIVSDQNQQKNLMMAKVCEIKCKKSEIIFDIRQSFLSRRTVFMNGNDIGTKL